MRTTYIYKLVDPLTREPRYVGKSVNPTARSQGHMYITSSSENLVTWIKSWHRRGYHPDMIVIEQCDESRADEIELFWVEEYTRQGYDLLNYKGITMQWPESP